MILTSDHLQHLSDFRYLSDNHSISDYLMTPFWDWLSSKIPHSVAPTTLSTIGFVINIFSTLVVLYFCPLALEQAPSWVYIQCAVGSFIYQTIDNLDGRQERKIGFLPSLSDMFDHGFDSISGVMLILSCGCATQLGQHPMLLFGVWAGGTFMFYVVHWQTYVTGIVKFCRFDVTDVQLVMIMLLIASGVFGPGIWAYQIGYINLEVKQLGVFVAALIFIYNCYSNFYIIYTHRRDNQMITLSGSNVFAPIVPIVTVLLLAVMTIHNSTSAVYQNHPCLFLLTFGIVAAKYINKYVLAKMSKGQVSVIDGILISPIAMIINQFADSPLDEYYMLWFILVTSFANLSYFFITVCRQICCHENMYCFQGADENNGQVKLKSKIM